MNTLFGHTSAARIIGPYRYTLTRVWEEERPRVCFVMLNPSTADASQEDPTIRRCLSFARSWGYGSLEVVNLFAWRATKPTDIFSAPSPVGEENDHHLALAFARAERIIAA